MVSKAADDSRSAWSEQKVVVCCVTFTLMPTVIAVDVVRL
jgi:hypothetical protein